MAKLYAEITSDKGGRTVSKGGNNEIIANFTRGNKKVLSVQILNSLITVHIPDNVKVVTTKGIKI